MQPMRAAFVAVGSELLGTDRLDTNSLWVTGVLERHGVSLASKAVVGDDEAELAGVLVEAMARADLVVVSGGLGPTADDITRHAVARALGRELTEEPAIVADIEAKFRSFGRSMPDVNRRQAFVVEGSRVLDNPRGTAPGLQLEEDGCYLFLLPGVPGELRGLVADYLEPWLTERGSGAGIERVVLKVACLAESEVEERVAPAYDEYGRESVTLLSSPGEIRIELRATGPPAERRVRLDAMTATVRGLVGPPVFSEQTEETLELVVGTLLRDRGLTVAAGESCTGGLLLQRLTAVAGSSEWVVGGVVAYANEAKVDLLGVDSSALIEHGAVSEPVARQLAEGARGRFGADIGIGITGIAGPSGGSDEKPVGTVDFGIAGPSEEATIYWRAHFPGNRDGVRRFAAQWALEMVRRRLLGIAMPTGVGGPLVSTP